MKHYCLTEETRDAIKALADFGDYINQGWCNNHEQEVLREYAHLCNEFMNFLCEQMWDSKE